jgi:hypothetical protein
VPITHRLLDGSTEDSTTHIETYDQLVSMLGGAEFLYVADCKLATRANMDHIAKAHGRFLTVMARTRKEDGIGRAFIASGAASFVEISRRPGKRLGDPPEVYLAAEAPSCSEEGYRIVWICFSEKRSHDAASRLDRIERARTAICELDETLTSKRSRLRTAASVTDAARELVSGAGASRWVRAVVSDSVDVEHRQEGRGRPGKDTRYRRIEHHRFGVTCEVDAAAVAYDAASDGCFPFITNDEASAVELLRIYKNQPHLERRHATWKGVIEAAPLTLKSDTRIDALGFCLYVALLIHALVERELRAAMASRGIKSLPLYHEERACRWPSAARVFELLEPLCFTAVSHGDELLAVTAPQLDPVQAQLLELLALPASAYLPSRRFARPEGRESCTAGFGR